MAEEFLHFLEFEIFGLLTDIVLVERWNTLIKLILELHVIGNQLFEPLITFLGRECFFMVGHHHQVELNVLGWVCLVELKHESLAISEDPEVAFRN